MVALFPVAWLVLAATVPLSGTVEDALGRPVAGAMVWLGDTIATHHAPEVLASGLTDEKGTFELQRPAELAGRGRMWSPTLWAFKPPHRIAFIEFKRNLPAADKPVRLALGSPSSNSSPRRW